MHTYLKLRKLLQSSPSKEPLHRCVCGHLARQLDRAATPSLLDGQLRAINACFTAFLGRFTLRSAFSRLLCHQKTTLSSSIAQPEPVYPLSHLFWTLCIRLFCRLLLRCRSSPLLSSLRRGNFHLPLRQPSTDAGPKRRCTACRRPWDCPLLSSSS